jgi:hypothetical protein
MKYTIAQFIPIILTFILLAYSKQVARFSHTILGKLIAVSLIIFYTYLDKYVGVFVCSLIILFYQSDCVENMLNMENVENVENMENTTSVVDSDKTILDDSAYVPKSDENPTKISYKELYIEETPINYELEEQFRKQNCDGNVLKYKEMKVKNEMVQHVFSGVKQHNNSTCNPCDSTCHFSIIEHKINTETAIKPIATN